MRTLLPELGPEIVESISLGSDKQAEHVIAGIRQLKRRPRQLALRLMKERTGPRPWDLREDPANAEWQERARGQGIDLTPWESDEPQFTAASPSGVELCFAFEHDPLEVMKMGLWFDTCLAPDSFNFFSTLANAADANKRVLVARDPKGTARARCLIAVSSSWNLIAFHVYAHDDGDWVRERIAAWLTELAESMGVTVAPAGSVPKLVASSWYDDGPVDITGVLAPMTPKSPFHRQLRKADEDETCALVTAELGEEVVRASLEPLLGMDPIFGSARRIASFAPFLLEAPLPRQLAIRTLDRLAQDHPETAAGILENWGRGRAFHRLQYEWGEDIQLARGLRHLGQARMALKVLRRRGAQGADEPAHQHETAATLDALGNRPAAMAIWRRLAQDGCERAATLLKTT